MTCAQGLLRLLGGGPEVGVLRDCVKNSERIKITKYINWCGGVMIGASASQSVGLGSFS